MWTSATRERINRDRPTTKFRLAKSTHEALALVARREHVNVADLVEVFVTDAINNYVAALPPVSRTLQPKDIDDGSHPQSAETLSA